MKENIKGMLLYLLFTLTSISVLMKLNETGDGMLMLITNVLGVVVTIFLFCGFVFMAYCVIYESYIAISKKKR